MTAQYLVKPKDVEKTLHMIWENLKKQSKLRASLFNLIIYSKSTHRVDYLRNVTQKVIEKFPCRIIFISDLGGSEKFLKTAVSVISPKEASQVACDSIDIAIGGDEYELTSLFILPHLLPDLPIYLLWADDPKVENLLFDNLKKLVNKIIFDSEIVENMVLFTEKISQFKGLEVADLNWARTENWRHLLTNYFNSEEKIKSLSLCKKITITYNAKASEFFCHTKIKALYLQAWLASCMQWRLQNMTIKEKRIHFFYEYKDKKIEVELFSILSDAYITGEITSLTLETSFNELFSFSTDVKNPKQIKIEQSAPQSCELPHFAMLEKNFFDSSLVKEIFYHKTSVHFLQSIQLLLKSKLEIC